MQMPPKKVKKSSIVRVDHPPAIQDAEYEAGEPRPHHRFYIEDGNTVLKVNNALFRVHRSALIKHSTVLGDMLALPRPSDISSPNQSTMADGYVELTGDSVIGWECLLGLLYPEDLFKLVVYTAKQWAMIVLLANKYVMESIEVKALFQLQNANTPLESVDIIILAQKVGSEALHKEAVQALGRRNKLMSIEDASKIGLRSFHEVITEHVKYLHEGALGVPMTPDENRRFQCDRIVTMRQQSGY